MAEKVTGVAWEDLMRQRLFGPLGMTSAGFGAPGSSVEKPDEPWGHGTGGQSQPPGVHADNPAAIGPGGTVHCSIEDWGKYIALHVEGEKSGGGAGERKGGELATVLNLKPLNFLKLHTSFNGPGAEYAMGWGVTTRAWAKGSAAGDKGRVLTHNGSNTMWFA